MVYSRIHGCARAQLSGTKRDAFGAACILVLIADAVRVPLRNNEDAKLTGRGQISVRFDERENCSSKKGEEKIQPVYPTVYIAAEIYKQRPFNYH